MSRSPTKLKIYKPHLQGPKSRNHWQIGSHLSQEEWDKIFRKKPNASSVDPHNTVKTGQMEIAKTPEKP